MIWYNAFDNNDADVNNANKNINTDSNIDSCYVVLLSSSLLGWLLF